jgi:hypothetical protein
MIRTLSLPAAIALVSIISVGAAPKIEFNTKTFQCDTIIEDKTEKLSATFIVKNSGDQPLKLENVRPGCGCTVVKFDSIIMPGKSSKINAEVNIKGYRAGSISKSITVTSNAANEKEVRLTIAATIRAVVELSDISLSFGGADTTKSRTVTLASKKHDLAISDVFFKQTTTESAPGWQNDIRLPVTYKWIPLDSIRPDGARVFKLELTAPKVETAVNGEIMVKTNHPEKPELKIQTYLAKR